MSIFVSIASYRDSSCADTLKSLFSMAEFSKNIFVGICQQNKNSDVDCLLTTIDSIDPEVVDNISIVRLDFKEAKGPTFARYLCSTLYKGQDYYLQVDSHTVFNKGWDTKLISMLQKIITSGLSEKPVISHYPLDIGSVYLEAENVPRICSSFFNEEGVISIGNSEILEKDGVFHITPYVSANMFFVKGSFLFDVPFDPYLPFLFTGEEILLSMRFYTAGYDVFSPTENVVYHKYTRSGEPKFWDDLEYSDSDAISRLKYFFGVFKLEDVPVSSRVDLNLYGPGKVRSVKDFYTFIGAEESKQNIENNFCANEEKEEFTDFGIHCSTKECKRKLYFVYISLPLLALLFIVFFVIILRKKSL